jgi:predicted nucleic acid-binding Zn ribbon protein
MSDAAGPSRCEACGAALPAGSEEATTCEACGATQRTARRVPWHFKLLMVATVIYLGYRAYQGVSWVVHHL